MNSIVRRASCRANQLVALVTPSILSSAHFTSSPWRYAGPSYRDSSLQILATKSFHSSYDNKSFHSSYDNNLQAEEACGTVEPVTVYRQALKFQRPTVMPWKEELNNTVHLMGIIGIPAEIKHSKSGKVWAQTRLGVKKLANSDELNWFSVLFWDDLAEIAAQHLKKNDHVYVSGHLMSGTIVDADQKPQTFYKVVANNLNFIESNLQACPDQRDKSTTVTLSKQNEHGMSSTSKKRAKEDATDRESLWQVFFANPFEWWDNRPDKKNPKCPDFKHKDTGEALWIDSKNTPLWVRSQLAVLDSRIRKSRQWKGGMSSIIP